MEYARLARLKAHLTVVGISELVAKTLPHKVVNNPRFWVKMVKLKQEELANIREQPAKMRAGAKGSKSGPLEHEFNYQAWVRNNTEHPEVEINY